MPDLLLRRTGLSDDKQREDYEVLDGGRAVGRIYAISGGFRGAGYAWFVYGMLHQSGSLIGLSAWKPQHRPPLPLHLRLNMPIGSRNQIIYDGI